MHTKVRQRLIGALVLIGLVVILVPIVFHNGNMNADTIAMSPIIPPAPLKPNAAAVAAQQAKTLTSTQQWLVQQAPAIATTHS